MQHNLDKIRKYIKSSFEYAEKEEFDLAIEHFNVVRLLLRTSVVKENTSQKILDSHTKIFKNEAQVFNKSILQNGPASALQKVVIVGDSLQLPRPEEKKLSDGGIRFSTSFMLQKALKEQGVICSVNTWGQRYLTTTALLKNWCEIVPDNLENSHFILHLGLNDYVERIFLEEERLAMNLYPENLRKEIVNFARKYRIDIIHRQLSYSYVPFDVFKKNMVSIIGKLQNLKAKSINIVNIIAFPPNTWNTTPRCMWNTTRFNMYLYQLAEEYDLQIIDLDRQIWFAGINDHLLPDKMHLSPKGHKILSDEILKVIKDKERMKKIAVIGVGQLGSRYLQGLSQIKYGANIYLVEPNVAAQKIAKERYEEMPDNDKAQSIVFFDSIKDLPNKIDVVIISTNSDIRFKLARDLIDQKNINSIVFEKVLFQKDQDYEDMKSLLIKNNIKAWVNHPRRLFSFYHKFLADFRASSRMNYQVIGGSWGLCCNSLHYLDHIMQLHPVSSLPEVSIDTVGLDNNLLESKRENFLEVCGSLSGKVGMCDFTLSCNDSLTSAPIINILSDTIKMTVDEVSGWARVATKATDWKWVEYNEKIIHYQSELTAETIHDIIDTGSSFLPTYEEAMHLHQPFIRALQVKLNTLVDDELSLCPIS